MARKVTRKKAKKKATPKKTRKKRARSAEDESVSLDVTLDGDTQVATPGRMGKPSEVHFNNGMSVTVICRPNPTRKKR